jgi:haloacetate dehalogenase
MFDGFTLTTIDTGEAAIRVRYGGSGPPLLLLHGIPQTHVMWHKIAPLLVRDFTVVAADLRGYGDSSKPTTTPDHAPYAMRALARDQVRLMEKLGFSRFNVAGHDRGARCAYRLALDYPERVQKLAVLDIVPTGEAFRRADMAFSLGFWVWSFLAAPYPIPEQLIGGQPQLFLDHMLDSWSSTPDAFPAEVRAEYLRTFREPATIHAICEEYRAAATLDYQQDEADRGQRRIRCPILALWSAQGALGSWYDPLAVWRDWADDVQGHALDCGHFLPEEAPDETYAALHGFFVG